MQDRFCRNIKQGNDFAILIKSVSAIAQIFRDCNGVCYIRRTAVPRLTLVLSSCKAEGCLIYAVVHGEISVDLFQVVIIIYSTIQLVYIVIAVGFAFAGDVFKACAAVESTFADLGNAVR